MCEENVDRLHLSCLSFGTGRKELLFSKANGVPILGDHRRQVNYKLRCLLAATAVLSVLCRFSGKCSSSYSPADPPMSAGDICLVRAIG